MYGRLILVLSLALATASCQLLGPGCETILLPGVRVTVLDSISGQPLSSNEVMVVATDGAYSDTALAWPGQIFTAVERAGTYRVQVTAPGYLLWVREGIRVEEGECGIQTTELIARMQPSG